MNLEHALKNHFEEDKVNFAQIEKRFDEQTEIHVQFNGNLNTMNAKIDEMAASIKKIEENMDTLSGIADSVKGIKLLKTPSLWLIGLILGIVTMVGGLKTITSWFITTK